MKKLKLPNGVCEDCFQCTVKCPSGFNVSAKIRDIVRVKGISAGFMA